MTGPACPICVGAASGTLKQRYEAAGVRFALYECPRCGVQYWEPRSTPDPSYYANESLSLYRRIHEGRDADAEDERYEQFLAGFRPTGTIKLLDVGCGSGQFLQAIAERGHEVWGIDFDPVSVQRARDRGLARVSCQSLDDFTAAHSGERFQYVTAFDVIEHLADPAAVLKTLHQMLDPGGTLSMTVPNRRRLLANQMTSDFPPHHFFRFDEASLRATLQATGFTEVRTHVGQFGYFLPTALDVVSKASRRLLAKPGRRGAASAASAPSANRPSPGWLGKMKRAMAHGSRVPSAPIERLLGRGFKIVATARR